MVGAILAVIMLILHPRVAELDYGDFGYSEAFLQNIADSPEWVGVHIGILLTALLLTGALLGLSRSITQEPGTSWAQLGYLSALLGTGIIVANMAVDGLALKVEGRRLGGRASGRKDYLLPHRKLHGRDCTSPVQHLDHRILGSYIHPLRDSDLSK